MREAFFGLQQGGSFFPSLVFSYSLTNHETVVNEDVKLLNSPTEATVLSNAGGHVNADALRSLCVLDSIVGVGTVIVVHHTGMKTPVTCSNLSYR